MEIYNHDRIRFKYCTENTNMKLTQYNIDCMSKSLNLSSAAVHPTEIVLDTAFIKTMWVHNVKLDEERLIYISAAISDGWQKGRLAANSPGGRRGVYNSDRYVKASNTKRQSGRPLGKPFGYIHTPQTKAKIKIAALKHIDNSKQKLAILNTPCSCIFCKKQTSYLWLMKNHKECPL